MFKQFHIRLTDRIKKQDASSKFSNRIIKIVIIILYPFILLLGLITLFFAIILSFFQKAFTSKGHNSLLVNKETAELQWSIFTQSDNLKIFNKYTGEVRFGPAYINLKSEPVIPYLANRAFGDWFFYHDKTLFLQQWNSIDKPNTDLIAIDTMTLELSVLQHNIPSVLWDIVVIENQSLQLNCDTGKEILKYSIKNS